MTDLPDLPQFNNPLSFTLQMLGRIAIVESTYGLFGRTGY